MASKKPLRETFLPSRYSIKLNGSLGKIIIKGRKIGRPSKRITLNQSGLKILSANLILLSKSGPVTVNFDRINHLAKRHEVRFHSPKLLYPGEYEIEIDYSLIGQKQLAIDEDFAKQINRKIFPCIDDPEAKAPIDIN